MFCFLHTTEMFIDTLYGWYLWFECILAYLIVFCEMHSLLTVEQQDDYELYITKNIEGSVVIIWRCNSSIFLEKLAEFLVWNQTQVQQLPNMKQWRKTSFQRLVLSKPKFQ